MLGDIHDEFYKARLVADARLHLGMIMNGQYSEPFFIAMCKIMSHEAYKGYKTFAGKEVKLSGIKDFLYSTHHGLGLKPMTINTFLANCAKAAIHDKTQTQYSMKFIEWLKGQDSIFKFPQELFELKRIRSELSLKYKKGSKARVTRLNMLMQLYTQKPHLLQEVGHERKYEDIVKCCEEHDIYEVRQKLKPIKLYRNPTLEQVRELAALLSGRLDRLERRVLIASLIEIYKRDQQSNDGNADRSD